jgi:hypothetical protein
MVVSDRDRLDVDDRQREPGPAQESARVAQLDEGRDTQAGTTVQLELGPQQRLAQLGQRRAAEQRRQQQPVRP